MTGFIHPTALIGSTPEHRAHIWEPLESGYLTPEIDKSAIVDAYCTVDAGLETPTKIGARSWLQKRVHVGHDAWIGTDCEICVGVVLGGHVRVGNGVRIGGNAWARPRITIGNGARIGGGAVVVKDVPAGEVWAGNPARKLVK